MSRSFRQTPVRLLKLANSHSYHSIVLDTIYSSVNVFIQVLARSKTASRYNIKVSKKSAVPYILFSANKSVLGSSLKRESNLVSWTSFRYSGGSTGNAKQDKGSQRWFTDMADNKYVVGYAKLGTSSCKKCKQKIDKGALRIGKVVPNPFGGEGGDMKQWFHPRCMFDTLQRARATTKKIEDPDDMDGFYDLRKEDKDTLVRLIEGFLSSCSSSPRKKTTPAKQPFSPPKQKDTKTVVNDEEPSTSGTASVSSTSNLDPNVEKDNSFRQFCRLCADIAEENSYTGKTLLVHNYLSRGHSGTGYQGDVYLLLKLLLPGVEKIVYNLNNKQLVKLFSQILGTDLQEMVEHLEQGDVAETVRMAFDKSKLLMPQKKSTLSLQEVDSLLAKLAEYTKEEDQQRMLTKMAVRSTANDLKMFIRLIKHDLRINAGAKHILDGLHPDAYAAFQASRNLHDVIDRVLQNRKSDDEETKPGLSKKLSVKASLMTPVLPMLAEACKSVEYAFKKCPNGIMAEIKYDGERVQVHKRGNDFRYFSRSLKPVLAHKVAHFKDFIPEAFPTSTDLILDAEVLLVDTATGKPLPFGTLGVHKKAAFADAKVCLFVFDCLLIDHDNLMERPMRKRREVLEQNMTEIPHYVMFSEVHRIQEPEELQTLMKNVFDEGLEGLVLKDANSIYEPGKRHWLKVKKDYLHEGKMADSADLIVLGAYYGTGNKGGLMSIFLMGCYDPATDSFCTVSKCGSGLDDKTLEQLQTQLDMVKISKDPGKVPAWLKVKKQVLPDFVARDPKQSPVWEIIGAKFSRAEVHTADGISIRFPRIQKFCDDKTWKEATDLPRLKLLYAESKKKSDLEVLSFSRKPSGEGSDDGGSDDGGSDEGNDDDDVEEDNSCTDLNISSSKESTPSKALKRKSSSEDSPEKSPTKKKKRMCKYGADCYQKHPIHRRMFDHPEPTGKSPTKITSYLQKSVSPTKAPEQPSKSPAKASRKKLQSTFHGCKIIMPRTTADFRHLRRYIIAFDGDLLPEYDVHTATHIITTDRSQVTEKGEKTQLVTPDWLWKCIRRGRLVPTDAFIPS